MSFSSAAPWPTGATTRSGSVARRWQGESSFDIAGVRYDERRWIEDDWATLMADWTVTRAGVRRTFRVRQRLYAGTELKALLQSVGFADVRLSGSLDGEAAYDENAARLVATARERRSDPAARRARSGRSRDICSGPEWLVNHHVEHAPRDGDL